LSSYAWACLITGSVTLIMPVARTGSSPVGDLEQQAVDLVSLSESLATPMLAGRFADMPSDVSLKAMNAVHRTALKLTGGRVGWKLKGMKALELTTTGRKSGLPRAVMLTSPLQEGDTIVVVASRGGDDTSPAWFHNLQANPNVQVAFAGKPKEPMTAHVATPAERSRLWPMVVADHQHYGGYQTKTAREIPLVLLTPRG
jgi:deazaflavin-dependent oxidoreductase (nitroreductase family)